MTSDANGLTRNADPEQGLQLLSAGGGKRDEVDPDGRVLRLFNHYRHDWMNDIQILFGYVKLKKYDKLLDLMEKINEKVRQESYISKLGLPSLIVRLLSFQAEVKELQLVLRMDEEIRMQDMKHADQAAEFLLAILECFRCEANDFPDENVLELRWRRMTGRIQVSASYRGGYDPARLIPAEDALLDRWVRRCGWEWDAKYEERKVIWRPLRGWR